VEDYQRLVYKDDTRVSNAVYFCFTLFLPYSCIHFPHVCTRSMSELTFIAHHAIVSLIPLGGMYVITN